jgi:hypothetical protein
MNRTNPLIQALSLIVAAALLGLAFLIGAVVIGVLLALGAVAALTLAIRIWWLRRKIPSAAAGDAFDRSAGQVIEGDYTVVGETDTKAGRPKSVSRDDAQSRSRDPAD